MDIFLHTSYTLKRSMHVMLSSLLGLTPLERTSNTHAQYSSLFVGSSVLVKHQNPTCSTFIAYTLLELRKVLGTRNQWFVIPRDPPTTSPPPSFPSFTFFFSLQGVRTFLGTIGEANFLILNLENMTKRREYNTTKRKIQHDDQYKNL